MMLNHIGQNDIAEKIYNAWLRTIEEGVHTPDIYREGTSSRKVGTQEFAMAVIRNLGQKPAQLSSVAYAKGITFNLPKYTPKPAAAKELLGVDVFVHWHGRDPEEIARQLQLLNTPEVKLSMITNRGIKVWPEGFAETFCTDHWRCRFQHVHEQPITKEHIVAILIKAIEYNIDIIKTENLYAFDHKKSFSLGQGQ